MPKNNLLVIILCCFVFVTSSKSYGQVTEVGTHKFVMHINDNRLKIPYYANATLENTSDTITRVIIMIHGTNRNADAYYETIQTAASLRPVESQGTLLIAPQFLTEEDIDFHNLDDEHLYWTNGGWKAGSNSRNEATNPRPERIPSYAVLDSLLVKISEIAPQLQSVVITGHSAGAQVTQRLAATSELPSLFCSEKNIPIKFISANPSSYLYLDGNRRIAGTLNEFEIPSTTCTEYNEWKYGLEALYEYPSNVGSAAIRNMLKEREVVYLLGEEDNDPSSPDLDTSCSADLQGEHRFERGIIYYNYLTDYYGDIIEETQLVATVPDVGHSRTGMFTSAEGLLHLFENLPKPCDETLFTDSFDIPTNSFLVYPNPAKQYINVHTPVKKGIINVYSLEGQLLKQLKITHSTTTIETTFLPSGTYLLKYLYKNTIQRKVFLKE